MKKVFNKTNLSNLSTWVLVGVFLFWFAITDINIKIGGIQMWKNSIFNGL